MKTISTFTLFTSVCLLSASAPAADFRDIDDLAYSLRNDAANLTYELRSSFRPMPQYAELYRDAYGMYQLADQIHEAAHHQADPLYLSRAVDELDARFHRIEHLMRRFDGPAAGNWHRGFAPQGWGGYRHAAYGYSNPYRGSRVRLILDRMEGNLHAMQQIATPVDYPVPLTGPYPYPRTRDYPLGPTRAYPQPPIGVAPIQPSPVNPDAFPRERYPQDDHDYQDFSAGKLSIPLGKQGRLGVRFTLN